MNSFKSAKQFSKIKLTVMFNTINGRWVEDNKYLLNHIKLNTINYLVLYFISLQINSNKSYLSTFSKGQLVQDYNEGKTVNTFS